MNETATRFKHVESLCGVARISIAEAFANAALIPEGELREEAVLTLEETLKDIFEHYKGHTEGVGLAEIHLQE